MQTPTQNTFSHFQDVGPRRLFSHPREPALGLHRPSRHKVRGALRILPPTTCVSVSFCSVTGGPTTLWFRTANIISNHSAGQWVSGSLQSPCSSGGVQHSIVTLVISDSRLVNGP